MKQVIFSALKFTAILSLAAFARMPAAAEAGTDEMGFHFGAGPAFVKVGDYCEGASAARASCDDSAIGFKVFGNYRFTETFGVEGGYMRAKGLMSSFPDTDHMGVPITYYINNRNTQSPPLFMTQPPALFTSPVKPRMLWRADSACSQKQA